MNRGVDKRSIVTDEQDRVRFVHNLYEMNNQLPAGNAGYYMKYMDLRNPYLRERNKTRQERQTLVHIHAWCLMDNHYHLLLSEARDGGLTTFFRKMNIGYANYFNEKYDRSGALFQGRTKRVLIERDSHFNYVIHYIHLNPLDTCSGAQRWREGYIKNATRALEHLASYRWSSYLDYTGKKNFPSILSQTLYTEVYPDYPRTIKQFLSDRTEHQLGALALE